MFTNVPGFLKPVYYAGKPAKKFFSLVSANGASATSIGIVSMPELCHITICADEFQIKDIDLFTSYFNKRILELKIDN